MFILLFGWYGFNTGSALHYGEIGLIALNTTIAAAAGGASSFLWSCRSRMPTLSSNINGVLGGLVGITASANLVDPWEAALIGAFSGILVAAWTEWVHGNAGFKRRIEDPVGAFPVHGLCGVFGGISLVLFAPETVYVGGKAVQLFTPQAQLGLSIGIPLIALLAVFFFLFLYDLVVKKFLEEVGLRQIVASGAEQGLGLDTVDLKEVSYDYGQRSDKPEDLLERFRSLALDFPFESINFDNCAAIRSDGEGHDSQPFKARFNFWLWNIRNIARHYSETFGEYAASDRGSANNIAERVENASCRLELYAQEISAGKKRESFKDYASSLVGVLDSLKFILEIHVQVRSKGGDIVDQASQDIAKLKRELSTLRDKVDGW